LSLFSNAVFADELLPDEDDFEVEYLAAPAVAGILLESAGVDNRYGQGKDGGNYIKDIANHMGPGTDFDGVSKEDVLAYECAIAAFLNNPNNGINYPAGVTCSGCGVIDPVASSVIFEQGEALHGKLVITILDLCGHGIEGLGMDDIVLVDPYNGSATLATLDAQGYWTMSLTEGTNGVYEVDITRDLGNTPFTRIWGVVVKNIDIGSVNVEFTYTTATYTVDLFVNGNPSYHHLFTFTYNRETESIEGLGYSYLHSWEETIDMINFTPNNYLYLSVTIKSSAEYPNSYTWYPAFTLNNDGTLTFIDGYGPDNVTIATGTWSVVYE
jgi:hypothetical protein